MISPISFSDLTHMALGAFADKPTSLTPGQQEATALLWSSPDGAIKIGIWECMPGHFTADRRQAGEYCHILSGAAQVQNSDGSGQRDLAPGDLLILPQGWRGSWQVQKQMRKLFILTAGPA